MLRNFKKQKNIITLIALTIGIIISFGYTLAAYVYNHRYENLLDYNTGIFKTHFDSASGDGTSLGQAYIISTPDHLRNLQALNVLGVFDKNTHFKLKNNITWSGAALRPIGTEDNPFDSQFNGAGFKIINLVVDGSQTNDIGMFGYVGMNSKISNFILQAPLIQVTNTNNTGKRTTNPLADIFTGTTSGGVLRKPSDLVLTLAGDQKSFTVNYNSIQDNDGVNHQIIFEIADGTYLAFDGSNNKKFNVINPGGDAGRFYRTQLAAKVFALYNNQMISYTLERWQINVTHDGKVNVASGSGANQVKAGHWRTINAAANEGFGPHETYVGFFAGHLDGIASHLGMWGGTATSLANNGKITVQGRAARAYNVLIGRSYEDNQNDDANGIFRRENVNFTEMGYGADKTFTGLPTTAIPNYDSYPTFFTSSKTVTNNASYDLKLVDSNFDPFYIRYWPGEPNSKILNAHEYYDVDDENIIDDSTTTANALQINGPLEGYTYSETLIGTSRKGLAMRNAIWFHLTSESVGSTFFRKERDYLVEMKVKYTVSGDATNVNRFQVLNNYANVAQSAVKNSYWTNVATTTGTNFNPNDYPLHQDPSYSGSKPRAYEHTIAFTLKSSEFTLFTDREYQLMFGLGVGTVGTYAQTNVVSHTGGFFGLATRTLHKSSFTTSSFSLQLLGVNILFSSLDGNVNPQAYKVDFINNGDANNLTYNATTDTWSNWNSTSNIKIQFNVDSTVNNTNDSGKYRFFRRNTTTPSVYIYQTNSKTAWNAANAPDYVGASSQGAY